MGAENAGEKRGQGVTRPALLAVLAVVMFLLSGMLRQYREITIPVAVVLLAWASYDHFRRRSKA